MQYTFYLEFQKEGLFCTQNNGSYWWYFNFQIQAALYFICAQKVLSALFLLGTHALTLNFVFLIIRRQMWTLFEDIKKHTSIFRTGSLLNNFYALSSRYLTLLDNSNRLFGPATFRFFLVAYPENAHLLMFMLMGKSRSEGQNSRSGSLTFGLSILIFEQFFVMFAVHIFSARMAISFHKPVKPLTTIFLAGSGNLKTNWVNKFTSIRARLRLALYIQALNVLNRYGLRYGKVGAVTYVSFGRSLVFYIKFLIYAYKLFS